MGHVTNDERRLGSVSGQELSGQCAVVAGATGNIGGAIARLLAARGASVVVHDVRQVETSDRLARQLEGGPHVAVCGDLTDSGAARRVWERAAEALGQPPTILVNAAYPPLPPRLVSEIDDDYLEAHLNGLRIHVNLCRAALPAMREARRGRIVRLAGALAVRPFPGFSLYGAVHASCTAFSRTLSLEEGEAGITVNTVTLGPVQTEAGETPPPGYELLDEMSRQRAALPQMPTPQDVANMVGYLVSPAASAVTGQVTFLAAGEPM